MPRFAAFCLAVASLAGCGAAFDGSTYRGDGFAFRIAQPPAAWRRLEVGHASVAFRDEQREAVIAVNGRCRLDKDDVPLRALTEHLMIGLTEREIVTEETTPFDGREALHTVFVAKLDGVPQKFDVYVMKKDGCVYDLYYVGVPDRYAEGAPEFERFVHGFSTLASHAD